MEDNPSYHILSAENADLIAASDVFDHPVDLAQLKSFISAQGHEMVFACVGPRVVGMASGTVLFHPDKQPAFFINEVGVEEDMQRRGIATVLCRKLIQLARDKGCKGIWLATEADNTAAKALYRKLDARQTDAIVVYDWDGAMDD